MSDTFNTLENFVGNTPLVQLKRLPDAALARRGNVILAKLEGNNPAGSVKDRPALSMIVRAEARGDIKPGNIMVRQTGQAILTDFGIARLVQQQNATKLSHPSPSLLSNPLRRTNFGDIRSINKIVLGNIAAKVIDRLRNTI